MGAGIGFGLDAGIGLLGFFQDRKDTADYNDAVRRRNRLTINAYETKNRNEENIWNNSKQDLDINTDQKYREAIDAISEAQLKAREVAGDAAIAQQKIFAQMFQLKAAREQSGRRTGGRGKVAMAGAQMAAISARAAFSRDAAILTTDKFLRNATAVAQGNYVKYITGRPSPAAPPILEETRSQPSFLNTALQIGSAGLNRYMQWQDKKAPDTKNTTNQSIPFLPSVEDYTQKLPFIPDEEVTQLRPITPPSYQDAFFETDLQNDLDEFMSFKRSAAAGQSLGFGNLNTYGIN